MWGAIASLAFSLLSEIAGYISSTDASKRAKEGVEQQGKENENWYSRRYNEDYTQRADAQRALTLAEENIKERNRAAAGKQAVQGGTEESVAATKAANAQTLADATSQIAAKGAEQKDAIDKEYHRRKGEVEDKLIEMDQQQAQNTAQAISGVNQSAGSLINAFTMDSGTGATGGTGGTDALMTMSAATGGGTRATGDEGSSILSQNITPTPSNPYDVNTPTSMFDVAAQAQGNNLNKVNADSSQVDWYNMFRA